MKKLFTLMVMALVAMSVNAKEVLTLPEDMGAGKTTAFGNWAWRDVAKLYTGADIASDATDAGVNYYDASAYDYLVIKYKECTVATNFGIQYNSKGTVGQWGPELYQSQEVISANTSGVLGVKLDADHKNKAYKVYLQTQGEGSLQIEEVYLGSTAEYEADVKANPVVAWYPETAEFLSKFSGTKNDDGTMTFKPAKEWDWLGAWFGDYDASYYSYVVVELAEPVDFTVQLAIQHVSGEDISLQVKAGEKAAILELSENKNHIKQAALQNAKVGDFTVKAVYFATNEYIQKNKDNILYGDTQDIALSGLNPWKNDDETARATFDATTGVLTITGPTDGGAGWWQGSADYSHFDNFVIELESTTAGGAVVVQYTAEEAAASRRANAQNKVEFGKGATCVVVPLNAAYKNAVQQMWIQGNSGASYTIKKAYVAVASATPEANLGTIEGGEEATGGEATDTKFNVTKYATLGDVDLKNCTTLYKYDETAKAVILTAYGAYQSSVKSWNDETKKGLGWVTYNSAGSSNVTDGWAASGVFQGSAYYGLLSSGSASHRAAAINSSRAYTFTVTGCKAVSILGKSGKKTEREVILTVKESGSDANFAEKKDATNEIVTLTVDGMDASKTYEVTVTGNTSDNGHFYEIAFFLGGTTGIQQTIAPAKVIENNVIYNLAGQKVNESYKGIVIKNGKKFIQK